MHISICMSDKQHVLLLSKHLKQYEEQKGLSLTCHFYETERELFSDFTYHIYDVLFFDHTPRKPFIEKIRKKDNQIRLVYVASSPSAGDVYEDELWFCIPDLTETLFLFPLLDRLASDIKQNETAGLIIQTRGSIVHLSFPDIEYAEVMGKSVFFHLDNGEVEVVKGRLSDFEQRLLRWPDFLHVHRSYIVNLNHVCKLTSEGLVTRCGDAIPVSRKLYPQLKKDYLCRLMAPTVNQENSKCHGSGSTAAANRPFSILLIDDEPEELTRWSSILEKRGCHVLTAQDEKSALNIAEKHHLDCIVLDVKLGNACGFDLFSSICEKNSAPVVYLSVLSDMEHQTQGFLTGGIDYITKDASEELFWLKLDSRIRMSKMAQATLSSGTLFLDLKLRKAFLQNEILPLTSIEFDLLHLLMQHPDSVYTPSKLYALIWGAKQPDDGYSVQHHMSQLCRKLEQRYTNHRFIEAVWGKGYRFKKEA